MAIILNIETATAVCSVTLSQDGRVLQQQISDKQNVHSELLTVFIEEVMQRAKVDFDTLDAIAVSEGPGSYTGLRIGASVAKGLCYSLEIPLITVSTLQAMAHGMSKTHADEKALYCPMIDARRMEVYTALYDFSGKTIVDVSAQVIDTLSFQKLLSQQKIIFGGDGVAKCIGVINVPNALFIDNFIHISEWMAPLSEEKLQKKQFVDIAYFEPFYLKEFVGSKPKKII